MTTKKHFAWAKDHFHRCKRLRAMTTEAAAAELGVSESSVTTWKRKLRVAEGKPPQRKKREWIHRRPQFSKCVRDAAKMIRAWKRPPGMDAHLEELCS